MTSAAKYDLVLRGGTLLDPAQGIHERRDVAFKGGRVEAVAPRIDTGDGAEVIDVSGRLVTPGLIDLHGHFFHGGALLGCDADRTCLPAGVTTALDAGTAGWTNYRAMLNYVFRAKKTRLLALLHISAVGLGPLNVVGGELQDLRYADSERTAEAVSRRRDRLVGVKVRMDRRAFAGADARVALKRAREAADKAQALLMVHVSGTPIPLPEILDVLREGDVATHIYNGHAENILDAGGLLRPEVKAAGQRGVIMDVAGAGGHLDFQVCRAALEKGFLPTTISTDMHDPAPGALVYGVHDLISQFHAMGLSLLEVVAASTVRPSKVLGLEGEVGSLAPGMAGDAAVFEQKEGQFTWRDGADNKVEGRLRLETLLTIREGAVVWRRESGLERLEG